jgi:hypothetical protein
LLYVPVASWTIYRLRWGFFTGLVAIVASVPPFGTLLFERWVAHTGRLAELSTPL